jgi:hypothetical protein
MDLVRLLFAAALLTVIVVSVRVVGWALGARTRRTVARLNRLAAFPPAEARILYFTSERCVQCRTRQEPALRALAAAAPEPLHVETFDAARGAGPAATYRILTAPSTVVVRADGRVAAINHGFAPAERIAAQLGWPSPIAP